MNNPSKKNSKKTSSSKSKKAPSMNQKEALPSKESDTYSSTTYEYVTKKRETLYNSSIVNLGSPKKVNPNRRIANKNTGYYLLIKRIALQLKQRVRLPTCKIIKIYQPYRTLIMRIAMQIKKTAKSLNFWAKWENKNNQKEKNKIQKSLMLKEPKPLSKKLIEDKEEINKLLNIDDSSLNANFMNEFGEFLGKNNIEIIKGTKLPSFRSEEKEYLLTNFQFWKRYINFICMKFNKEVSFYNFINLIEQFYLWIKDPNDAALFNKIIIQKMELTFEPNEINEFLLNHNLNNLDDLFAKYKNIDNSKSKSIEIKLSEYCECPTCQNIKENGVITETIKFQESNVKNRTKNSKITDYYGLSLKLKTSKYKTQKKITKYTDEKIWDYFPFSKAKKEKSKTKSKSKNKSRSKSKSKSNKKINKNKNKNKSKKHSANDKVKEILDMLNLELDK